MKKLPRSILLILFFLFITTIVSLKKISAFLFLLIPAALVALLTLAPIGNRIQMNHPTDFHKRGNQERFSLQYDDTVCHVTKALLAFPHAEYMNPRNSNAFFDPKICICASTQFTMFTWLGINPVCGRPVLGATESCYSPPPDGVAHGYNGIYNRGYVCAANVIAPKNKKELYRWLARIQNSMYPALSTPNLISVINGDLGPPDDPHNNAINNGFCTFRDINFDKIELPNLKNGGDFKKYISTYPGQRMICALDITNVWLFMPRPSAERYSSPEKCMEKLKDLVKCVLVPMGPPPLPLTPFIVHDIQANVVYDSNPLSTASTIKPNLKVRIIDTKGRLIELKPNQEIKEGDNLFNLQDHTGQTTDNYEIKIM